MNNDLITVGEINAVEIFEKGELGGVLEKIREEIDRFSADVETRKGRDEIKSFAYKIARSKTLLDGMGKDLVAEIQKKKSFVDAGRKEIRNTLDNWRDEVRKPLTDYEDAKKLRIETITKELDYLDDVVRRVGITETSKEICTLTDEVRERYTNFDYHEFTEKAVVTYKLVVETLNSKFESLQQKEAQEKELVELREKEKVRAAEAKKQEGRQIMLDDVRDLALEGQVNIRDAKTALEHIDFCLKNAEPEFREELKKVADVSKKRILADLAILEKTAEAEQQMRADEAEKKRKEHEAAIAKEAARQEKERAEKAAEAERQEQAKREADKKHRNKILGEVDSDIAGVLKGEVYPSEIVEILVNAIIDGKIRNLKIIF